jgi:uncharacterized protein YcfJ
MKNQIKFVALVTGVCAVTASHAAEFDDYARVVNVTPQVEQVNQPRQQCWTENVAVQQPSQPRGVGGSIIGGIAGGLLGSQVGGGNGRVAAAAVGAMTGAVVGDRMENNQAPVVSERPVQRCRTVDEWVTRNNGYLVTYEYRGNTYTSVMPYQPGNRMRVHVSVTPQM